MYDFPIFPQTATLASWIYQGILYAIIFFSFKKTCLYAFDCKRDGGTKFFLPFLVIVYVITAFTAGDFSHYQIMVKEYSGPGSTGLENIYEYVIALTNQNYFLFRTLLFGGMVLLLLRLLNNYGLDRYSSLFFLFAVFINTLSYSRASIGMTVFFFGLSLLFSDNRTILKFLIGVTLVVCSYFFHRSCIVLIPLALLGFMPISKRIIPIILVAVALTFTLLKNWASDLIVDIMLSSYDDLAHKAEIYATGSSDQFTGNLIAWVMHIWEYSVYYIFFIVDAYYILNHKNEVSKSIRAIFNTSFGILLFAILMYFFNMADTAIYYRYLFMLMIPTTIMTTYLYQNNIMPYKRFQFLFWFGCIPVIEGILYHIYYLLLH